MKQTKRGNQVKRPRLRYAMRKILADRDVRICLLVAAATVSEIITALMFARVPWTWGKTAETCTFWLLVVIVVASWSQLFLVAADLVSLLWTLIRWMYHKLRGNMKQGRLNGYLAVVLQSMSRPVRDIWVAAVLANVLFALAVAHPGVIPAQLKLTAFAPPVILLVELALSVALVSKKTPAK